MTFGRSLFVPLRELSTPLVTLKRVPLVTRMIGATCQLLSSRLTHGLSRLTLLSATRDVLKLCRRSKLQGPRSAERFPGTEFGEPPSSPVKSKSETHDEFV